MVSTVLEPDVDVEREETTATRADQNRVPTQAAPAPGSHVVVRCSLCGGTHPPRDDNDPQCPVEGF